MPPPERPEKPLLHGRLSGAAPAVAPACHANRAPEL